MTPANILIPPDSRELETAHPICRACETENWCRVHGCIPVTDPVDEELADAIADLCNPPLVHLAVSTLDAPSAASNHRLRLVVGTAPTELGRPL